MRSSVSLKWLAERASSSMTSARRSGAPGVSRGSSEAGRGFADSGVMIVSSIGDLVDYS
jgi:hypothetical protein